MNVLRSLVVAFALCPAFASAQGYLFVSLSPHAQVVTNIDGVSDTSAAASFGVGYRFGRHFAAEASYFWAEQVLGTSPTFVQGSSRFTTTHQFEAYGPGIAALGTLPFGEHFALLAKGGAYYLRHKHASQTNEHSASSPFAQIATHINPTTFERRWSPSLGVGAELKVDHLAIRALVEQLSGRGELGRIRLLSVQLLYSF